MLCGKKAMISVFWTILKSIFAHKLALRVADCLLQGWKADMLPNEG